MMYYDVLRCTTMYYDVLRCITCTSAELLEVAPSRPDWGPSHASQKKLKVIAFDEGEYIKQMTDYFSCFWIHTDPRKAHRHASAQRGQSPGGARSQANSNEYGHQGRRAQARAHGGAKVR